MGYVPPPIVDPGKSTAENRSVFYAWCDERSRLHSFQAAALVAGLLGIFLIAASVAIG